MYVGGSLSDRWMKRGIVTAPLRVVIPCAIAVMILFPIALTQGNPWITLALSALGLFFLAWPMGTSFAAVQYIFPNQVRGQVSALLLFGPGQ